MAGTTPRLRADARRNRDLIVTAAQRLFLEQGIDVPLDEVARRAGVGIGTLYRRFPDRDALLRAVAEDTLRRLADLVETARREEPDAWHALCRFLRSCAELRLGELAARLDPRLQREMRTGQDLDEIRQRVIAAVLELTARAQADGTLRADAGPLDIAMVMTLHVYAPANVSGDQAVRRMVEIMLDGLRAGGGTALPGAPSTDADLRRYTAVEP
ncbi:TetR/AcrR family transcriptional regulator [Spongiactinospora sp. 9N601]|uniref:TetR/AcrR family transcriptional regulator n=1 Tax=Spongiactinospora sp. 9N601 TaxID=3375149 RepID=UPI0037B335DF